MSKISIYHPWIYLKGGAEKTILELVKWSKHDWTIYTNRFERENTFSEFTNFQVVELSKVSVKRDFINVIKSGLKIILQKKINFEGELLVISSEGFGDFINFKKSKNIPSLCFCHTPLKVLHDKDTKERFIKQNGGFKTLIKLRILGTFFMIANKLAWRKYNGILCNSNEVKKRVVNAGLADLEQLEVANPGVDIEKYSEWKVEASEKHDYLLIPGRIMWTKDIEFGIEAYLNSNAQEKNIKLVIAGMVDEKSRNYLKTLQKSVENIKMVEFVISPSEMELLQLYKNCIGVLFTPPNEDWGIVPIEGMASGKPVISRNSGGPKESIKHNVTGYLTGVSNQSYVEAINKLLNLSLEEREYMGIEARKHAEKYSWRNFAKKIDDKIDFLLKKVN
ncbi:putative Glycosyl transferase family 1 [Bacillus sp. 349Y]|nr:putative Glycosyl transferase family 1 [Bacillus sp. 349Y]